MITTCREVRTSRPVEVVAPFLSDFTTSQVWDPHTERCDQLGGTLDEPVVGARYENVQMLLGRATSFVYTVTEYTPGRRIRLHGTSKNVEATDTMTFDPAPAAIGTGTLVVYEAAFEFSGLLSTIEPLLKPLIRRVANTGAAGMHDTLERL